MIKNTNKKGSSKVNKRWNILAIAICMMLLAVPVHAEEQMAPLVFAGGDGTEENPYQVATAEQLDAVRNDRKAHYIQVADIDLVGWNWVPIQNHAVGVESAFCGSYNGNGYKISNLSIKATDDETRYCGLFAYNDGQLENIALDKINIDYTSANGNCRIGAVTGDNNGLIKNCTVSGVINVKSYDSIIIGGISGASNNRGIVECINECDISAICNSQDSSNSLYFAMVGGIVGHDFSHSQRCINRGNISVLKYTQIAAGGIAGIGSTQMSANYGNIQCEVRVSIRRDARYLHINCGGISGTEYEGNLTDCINYGDIIAHVDDSDYSGPAGTQTACGGIVGYHGKHFSIMRCYNMNHSIESTEDVGSFYLGRVIGHKDHNLSGLYSLNTTLLNGEIPTEELDISLKNGESLTKEDMETHIQYILDELEHRNVEADTDVDGLLDEWEVNGIDYVHDGMTEHLDLPAMGADPKIPDIFIEVDYMYREGSGLFKQGKKDYRMPKEVYNIVYQAFKEKGINIHIDAGKDSIMNFDTKERWGDLSRSNDLEYIDELELGWNLENWEPFIESSFDPIRHAVFRHCSLIGKFKKTNPNDEDVVVRDRSGTSSGIPSQMFIVALDCTEKGDVAKAGTFMHELGHTLGLSHGGLYNADTPEYDHQTFKPNHLSIMNYRYQFSGLKSEKKKGIVNYQDFYLPEINEKSIDEIKGINPSDECIKKGMMINYNGKYYKCKDSIDFNKNGKIDKQLIEFDLNPEDHDGDSEPVTNLLTETLNEWEHLKYKAGSIGGNGAAILTAEDLELHVDPNAEARDELTIEEALRAGVLGTQDECKILTDELSPLYSDMVNQKLFVAVENLYHADTVVGITVSSDMLENAFYEEVEIGASVSSIAMKTLSLGVKDNLSPGTYTINFSLKLKNGEVIEQSAEVTVAKPEVKTIKVGFEEELTGDAIEWQTSDPAVLRIEDTKVTAITEGNAYLYGIDSSGLYEFVYVIHVEADSGDSVACPVFGFCTINGKKYWYEDGLRQGVYGDPKNVRDVQFGEIERGREIYDPETDAWYWLDAVYDGAAAYGKEVWMPYIYQDEKKWDDAEVRMNADNVDGGMKDYCYKCMKEATGKWVRYDESGAMLKGWVEIKGELAKLYPDQKGNTYYYDHFTGLMAKGWLTIDGELHHFDEITGVMME